MNHCGRLLAGKQPRLKPSFVLLTGVLLSFSAGAVNGVSTVALVFQRTTHMSGRINDLMRDLIFNPPAGLLIASLIASFALGAFIAGILVPRRGASFPFLFVSALLATAAATCFAASSFITKGSVMHYFLAVLLALASGLQNGTTSLSAVGRTTHITGDLTDLALALSLGKREHIACLIAKLVSFSAGGIAGFVGVEYSHPALVLILCALLVLAGRASLQQLEAKRQEDPKCFSENTFYGQIS